MGSIRGVGRRALLWGAGIGAAIPLLPVVAAEEKSAPYTCSCGQKIRPSKLPIYEEPEDLFDVEYHVAGKGQVQEGVEVVRKELTGALDATKEFRDQVEHVYQTGKAHSAALLYKLMEEDMPLDRQIDYLLDEENVGARAGVMAAGGLVGLLLGARKKGGILKKLVFMTAGVGATTAALYPQYTRRYTDDLVNNASTYTTVAYNFISGVKPQQLAEPSSTPPAASQEPSKSVVVESKGSQKKEQASSSDDGTKDGKPAKAEEDHGQSNPSDADMYTTRS